jgi:hypothetical protein
MLGITVQHFGILHCPVERACTQRSDAIGLHVWLDDQLSTKEMPAHPALLRNKVSVAAEE